MMAVWNPRGTVVGVVVAAATLLTTTAFAERPTGQAAGPGAQDFASSVTIIRDTYGVPHIYAPTDAGVVFGAAYAQAEDNWWQVEDNFVRSVGRAAELYGEDAFVDDYLARALEIRRRSIEEYERAPTDVRALYDAYADGFNHYLESNPEVERRLLDRVEPWHTLALIRFKYHHNEYIGYAGMRRQHTDALLRTLGLTPKERGSAGMAFQRETAPTGEPTLGSNEMAVAGSRTASGAPMLLINPHVAFFGLSQYWEVHLESEEGLVFSGLSRYGFMLPYMGNSDVLGWAYTDNYGDIGDLYLERFDDLERPLAYRYGEDWREAVEWSEPVVVTGMGTREVRFRKTHHGPILGLWEHGDEELPMAVRLSKLDEGGWYEQWYRMMRARSFEEWKAAKSMLNVPYMNTMYADRDGNIFYLYNHAVPIRDTRFNWLRPVDGSDPETEWDGYHGIDELPQVLNPESGWLQNTNSDPLRATVGLASDRSDYPPYLIGSETHNARARSATRVLSSLEGATLDEFARAALDTRMSEADEHVPRIVAEHRRLGAEDPDRAKALEAVVRALIEWDHRASVGSVATTAFVLWAEIYLDRARPPGQWARMTALERALEGLREDWGTWEVPWGELNRAQRPDASGEAPFDDALSSVPVAGAPGWLGSLFTYHTRPAPGGKRRYGVHGNSFVKVVEFGPEIRARSILTFGQHGDPTSPHYFDQAEIYGSKGFKPAWFARAEVEANAERIYSPGDGPADRDR